MSRYDLAFALAALAEEHGSSELLIVLRDACREAADIGPGTSSLSVVDWRKAAKALDDVCQNVQSAEAHRHRDGVTLSMSLSVLADLAEDA